MTTFAGDHVALTAPPELIEFYKGLPLKGVREDSTLVDHAFAWIHGFADSNMTGGNHVMPLVTLGFETLPVDHFALLTCIILARHNQEPWLHDRMTFHGLADIQQAWLSNSVLREMCQLVDDIQSVTARTP